MEVLVFTGPGTLELLDVDEPEVADGTATALTAGGAVSRSALSARLLIAALIDDQTGPGPQGLAHSPGSTRRGSWPGNGRKQTVTATTGGAPGAVHTMLATRLGTVTLVREEEALTGLYFPRHWPRPDRTAFGPRADEGFGDIARQLGEYLDGERRVFGFPVKINDAGFDRRVWELIAGVPYGETTTYGDLARALGAGTDPRDVGAAVGRNPLCIVIPCHRVVGSTGKLTGYAGGLDRKRTLLEIEHAQVLHTGHAAAPALW